MRKINSAPSEYITLPELAKLTPWSYATLRAKALAGDLGKPVRFGPRSKYHFRRGEILQFLGLADETREGTHV